VYTFKVSHKEFQQVAMWFILLLQIYLFFFFFLLARELGWY